jgi:hypothetical protein
MRSAYRNLSPEEFVAFVLDHSVFTRSEPLGSASDQRPLYRLSR